MHNKNTLEQCSTVQNKTAAIPESSSHHLPSKAQLLSPRRARPPTAPPHAFERPHKLRMHLTVGSPPLAQLLHANRSYDCQTGRLERGLLRVDGDIWCDAHLRDQVKVFLVTIAHISTMMAMGRREQ